MRCVEACRVDEVFADSKFLEAESLLHMVRALTWAAGPAGAAGAGAAITENGGGGSAMDGAVSAEDEVGLTHTFATSSNTCTYIDFK